MKSEIIGIVLMSFFIFTTLWIAIKQLYCYLLRYKVGLLECLIDVGFCFGAFVGIFFSLWYYTIYSDPQYPTLTGQIIVVIGILIIPFFMSFIKAKLFQSLGIKKIKYFYGLHFIFLYVLLVITYTIAQIINYFIINN